MVATKISIILGQTLTLERVWKVLFHPLNRPTKAPAILGDFQSVSPQTWGVREAFKQALGFSLMVLLSAIKL
ncbi:hypothetical protein BWK47_06395 [Synechocystis sp. CACIAM 05]|nr:hypothetical protein BWK47_06395 [Synechocystis sp. CACIAM 05]